MVVAQVVRIRNRTLRTFQVRTGDLFYTPRLDGKPCPDGIVEVPPGSDQATDGLVVPWRAALTRTGLEITETESGHTIRCAVGPLESDGDNQDWLQYLSSDWEPLSQDHWLPLGERHFLGAVGKAIEMQLTFREDTGRRNQEVPINDVLLEEMALFEFATRCASYDTVFLNVFDLVAGVSIPNAILCNTIVSTVGAFHAAVEVYGEEFSFYRTPNPSHCGIARSRRPREHHTHVYRQSVNLGPTSLKDWEVRYLIACKLAPTWPGGGYDLLYRNCIHFCDELVLSLGVRPVPPWVRGLHETGASAANVLRVPWPLSLVFGGDRESGSKPQAQLECAEDEARSVDAQGSNAHSSSRGPRMDRALTPKNSGSSAPLASSSEVLDMGSAPSDSMFIDAAPTGHTKQADPSGSACT